MISKARNQRTDRRWPTFAHLGLAADDISASSRVAKVRRLADVASCSTPSVPVALDDSAPRDIRAAPGLHEDEHVDDSSMPSSFSSSAKRRRVNDIVAQSRHVAYYTAIPAESSSASSSTLQHAIRRLLL